MCMFMYVHNSYHIDMSYVQLTVTYQLALSPQLLHVSLFHWSIQSCQRINIGLVAYRAIRHVYTDHLIYGSKSINRK
jgi:hypothetical protein